MSRNPLWRPAHVVLATLILTYVAGFVFVAAKGWAVGESLCWGIVPAVAGTVALSILVLSRFSVNGRLRDFLEEPRRYRAFNDRYPTYRYVDWYRALERYAAGAAEARRLDARNPRSLEALIRYVSAELPANPTLQKICIGYEEFGFFPEEVFWLLRGPDGFGPEERIVLRVRREVGEVVVEVAATAPEAASAVLKRLEKDALAHSIFRGQFLEVRYSHDPHADYEYMHRADELTVTFQARPNVTAADIILDEKVEAILRRNLFDFFAHRDRLHELGLPRKRALLFYGPPGTGKTHTCRFVHTFLKGVTTILATGEALARMEHLGKLARQLQPTLVILEDVDLVFVAREVNPYGLALGDLMDQLDGFTPDEEVIFLLTTNAIDRVEAAIRDRPGRINQCLHFGLPGPELRRRYLERYLRPYDASAADLDHLVKQTEQTSQAFLKEYVLRAVQVAAESAGYGNGEPVRLRTEHFDAAFEELTSHGDPHGHSIMGFRTPPRAGA